jgi:hypothetical protein
MEPPMPLHGGNANGATARRVREWMNSISSTESAPALTEAAETHSSISFDSRPFSPQSTAPATVQKANSVIGDLTARRIKKIQVLMSQEAYSEAVPHIRRAIEQVESKPELFAPGTKPDSLQLNLAKALIKSEPTGREAESLLYHIWGNEEGAMTDKSEAAYYLASLLSKPGSTKLSEAKTMGEFAAESRGELLGCDDPKTYQAIKMLAEICHKLEDVDEELWLGMLPETYEVLTLDPTILKYLSASLPQPALRRSWNQKQLGYGSLMSKIKMDFSPCGKLLATYLSKDCLGTDEWSSEYSKNEIRIRDARLGSHLSADYGCFSCFFPENKSYARYAVMADATESEPKSFGVCLQNIGVRVPFQTLGNVSDVLFSPNCKLMACTSIESGRNAYTLYEVDAMSHTVLRSFNGPVMAFSPDSKLLACSISSLGRGIQLQDVPSGKSLRTLNVNSSRVSWAAFSPNSKLLAMKDEMTVQLWDVDTGTIVHTLDQEDYIQEGVFSPDGKLLALAFDNGEEKLESTTFKLLDIRSGSVIQLGKGHNQKVWAVGFGPNFPLIASGDNAGNISVWGAKSGEILQTFKAHSGLITMLKISPDCKVLASAGVDQDIIGWQIHYSQVHPPVA